MSLTTLNLFFLKYTTENIKKTRRHVLISDRLSYVILCFFHEIHLCVYLKLIIYQYQGFKKVSYDTKKKVFCAFCIFFLAKNNQARRSVFPNDDVNEAARKI